MLFPTKALARDQLASLRGMATTLGQDDVEARYVTGAVGLALSGVAVPMRPGVEALLGTVPWALRPAAWAMEPLRIESSVRTVVKGRFGFTVETAALTSGRKSGIPTRELRMT